MNEWMKKTSREHGIQLLFFYDSSELNLKWPLWLFFLFRLVHNNQVWFAKFSVSIGGQSIAVSWLNFIIVFDTIWFFGGS